MTLNAIQRKISESPKIFVLIWVLVNLIQAFFTELAHDEAYYWVYSNHLDIGYFDHPPAIAFMIKLGYMIFQNELGVRLLAVFASAGTLLLCREILDRKHFALLFLLFVSLPVFQVFGFIAVPDSPLLFFTSLFILAYQRFLDSDNIRNTLFVGFAVAFLLYSKYHGILILFFTVLSNPSMLRKKNFYLATAISIVLFMPHVIWQITHDFPTIKYHLTQRSPQDYNPVDTVNYILGQWLIFSPIMSAPLFYFALKRRPNQLLNRAPWFNLIGFLAFFFFTTFSTRVEPNWTSAAAIPLILLSVQNAAEKEKWNNLLCKLSLVSTLLIIILRVHLVYPILPSSMSFKTEFHGWRQWANEVKEFAQGKPVVFANSYQKAAKYSFYTGDPSFSSNSVFYRKTQYDLWDMEDEFVGKDVLWVSNWPLEWADTMVTSLETRSIVFIDNFQSYQKIAITIEQNPLSVKAGTDVDLNIILKNNYDQPRSFIENSELPVSLWIVVLDGNKLIDMHRAEEFTSPKIEDTIQIQTTFEAPITKGDYNIRIGLRSGMGPPAFNSGIISLQVTD